MHVREGNGARGHSTENLIKNHRYMRTFIESQSIYVDYVASLDLF